MKTGKCLVLSADFDDKLASIEGHFADGLPHGEIELNYFDGKLAKVSMVKGIMQGQIRTYESVKDDETNLETVEKRLCSIANMVDGVKDGPEWTLNKDQVKVLKGYQRNQAIAIVPETDYEIKVLVGILEDDDMMVKVREGLVTGIAEQNGIKYPVFETHGETFDYDLQVRSQVRATVAKLVRFFEITADEQLSLSKNFAPHPEPVDTANANILLKVIKKVKNQNFFRILTNEGEKNATFDGTIDKSTGNPNGYGVFKILSEFKRKDILSIFGEISSVNETEETGTNSTDDNNDSLADFNDQYLTLDALPFRYKGKMIKQIAGTIRNGLVEGLAIVKYTDGSSLEGLCASGSLHGIVRELAIPFTKGRRKRYVRRHVENVVISTSGMSRDNPIAEVTFVASYRNGFLNGPGWKFLVGGSFLFGKFQKSSTFTTNHGAHISQDLETGYFGRFVDGKMMSGQLADIIGEHLEDGIRVPEFSEPKGRVFKALQQSDQNELVDALVTDTTEDSWVYVNESSLGSHVGQGLFAKRDIPENTVVAFFGGLKMSFEEWNRTKPFEPQYWRKNDEGDVIYLPNEIGRDISRYRATLGHKINHSFAKWNCMFHDIHHPRFGTIPAARTTERVSRDSELLCFYDWKFDEGGAWFQELWRQQLDSDFIYEPYGHRGEKRNSSDAEQLIEPMLDDGTLYNSFYKHAVEVLKLSPYV